MDLLHLSLHTTIYYDIYMKYRAKSKKKPLYVLLIKATNRVFISITKQYIADTVGIHSRTITRNMGNDDSYSTDEYSIWKNILIHHDKARNHPKARVSGY